MLSVRANVLGYLAGRLDAVFDAAATDLVDIIPQVEGKSAEGVETKTEGAPRNGATPLPAVVRDTGGREIYIAAQSRTVVGCYATLPAVYGGQPVVVKSTDLLRTKLRDALPSRSYQVEHVNDQTPTEIVLVVTKVGG